jgi:hypothetical protein
MARLYAVLGKFCGGLYDLEGDLVEPVLGVHQPIFFEFAHKDRRCPAAFDHFIEPIAAARRGLGELRALDLLRLRRGTETRRRLGLELLTDDAQRQELVALQPQDRAQTLQVLEREQPIPARRPLGRDQFLIFEVPNLGNRDAGEVRFERIADRPDRQPHGIVCGHLGALGSRRHWWSSTSRNLPICTSSPFCRRSSS